MALKIIINIFLIIILAVIQAAFISGLPAWFNSLNLLLVVIIFILGFASLDLALYWALLSGLILELFSFLPFGAHLSSLILTVIAANYLLNYLFTNRSLYSFLALAALATAVNQAIIYAFIFLLGGLAGIEPLPLAGFLTAALKQICLNLAFTLVIFYFIHALLKNFKPMFLVKNKA